MPSPLVIVLFVSTADADAASTKAMTETVRDATEPAAIVVTREGTPASDHDVARVTDSIHANSAVVVTWKHGERWIAQVRVFSARQGRWSERELAFGESDAPIERGRAVGFAISSMVPELEQREPAPPANLTPPSQPQPQPQPDRPRATPDIAHPVSLELVGNGVAGVGGTATGVGAELAGRWKQSQRFAGFLGVGFRAGKITSAQATLDVGLARAGVAWETTPFGTPVATLGARLDVGLAYQVITRTDLAQQATSQKRFLPFTGALVEAGWSFASRAALVGAAGVEIAWGSTRVVVGSEQRDTVPPLRFVGEAGIRVLF